MKELLLNYLNILFAMFKYDLDVFTSHKWIIYTVVPGVIYLVFFFVKWLVLTTPVWMPFSIIFSGRSVFHHHKRG